MADDIFADPTAFGFETRAIRAGQVHDPSSGAVVTPISLATTFVQETPGQHRGYEYSRTNNPTRQALQECLAARRSAARSCVRVGHGGRRHPPAHPLAR